MELKVEVFGRRVGKSQDEPLVRGDLMRCFVFENHNLVVRECIYDGESWIKVDEN